MITIISDAYLKSVNCMYEALEIMRDRNYQDKIFPVVVHDEIYSPYTRIGYIKYWQEEFLKLKNSLKKIEIQNIGNLNEDLKRKEIMSFLPDTLIYMGKLGIQRSYFLQSFRSGKGFRESGFSGKTVRELVLNFWMRKAAP